MIVTECYEVTWCAEIRWVTRILCCNNHHYRSSCCSRMYWARKLILRDAQFSLGYDGSRMSRDSIGEKRDKNIREENRWKATRGAGLINYIVLIILVVPEISICEYIVRTYTFACEFISSEIFTMCLFICDMHIKVNWCKENLTRFFKILFNDITISLQNAKQNFCDSLASHTALFCFFDLVLFILKALNLISDYKLNFSVHCNARSCFSIKSTRT